MARTTPDILSVITVLMTIHLLQYGRVCEAKDAWRLRPGIVHVCEGNTARLVWNYTHDLGTFNYVYFHKIHPDWKFLIGLHKQEEPLIRANGVHLIENSTYGMTIDNVILSHSGTYEIEIYFEEPGDLIYDKAEIRVLKSSVCPNQVKYLRPAISYIQMFDESKNVIGIYNKTLELLQPGNVRLSLAVPAADPPVRGVLSTGQKQHFCTGRSNQESECEKDFYFGDEQHQVINVTLTFIALEPSITMLHVYTKDDGLATTIQHMKTVKFNSTLITSIPIPVGGVVTTASHQTASEQTVTGEPIQDYVEKQQERISSADIAGIVAAKIFAGVLITLLLFALYKNRNAIKLRSHSEKETLGDEMNEIGQRLETNCVTSNNYDLEDETKQTSPLMGRKEDLTDLQKAGQDTPDISETLGDEMNEISQRSETNCATSTHYDIEDEKQQTSPLLGSKEDLSDFQKAGQDTPDISGARNDEIEPATLLKEVDGESSTHSEDSIQPEVPPRRKTGKSMDVLDQEEKCKKLDELDQSTDLKSKNGKGLPSPPPRHTAKEDRDMIQQNTFADNTNNRDIQGNSDHKPESISAKADTNCPAVSPTCHQDEPQLSDPLLGSNGDNDVQATNGRAKGNLTTDLGESELKLLQQSDKPPLHQAAMKGNMNDVKSLMKNQVIDLNETDSLGYTPLAIAAVYGQVEVVKYLLKHGSDVDFSRSEGFTPLYLASREGHTEVVNLLCKSKANVNKLSRENSPLCAASAKGHVEVVKSLIKSGSNLNLAGVSDYTPLHLSSGAGHLPIVRILLKSGADLYQPSQSGQIALDIACENRHTEILDILAEKCTKVHPRATGDRVLPDRVQDVDNHETNTPKMKSILEKFSAKREPDAILAGLTSRCPNNLSNVKTNANKLKDETYALPMKAIQQLTHLRVCKYDLDGEVTECFNSDVHEIHTQVEKLLHNFCIAICPHENRIAQAIPCKPRRLSGQRSRLGKYGKRDSVVITCADSKRHDILELTGSFYSNNQVGNFDELKYFATWEFSNISIDKGNEQHCPTHFSVTIPKENNYGLQCTPVEYFSQSLKILLKNQLSHENMPLGDQVRYQCNPQGSGVCVQLSWDCPEKHTHDLRLIITPAIVWEDKRMSDICGIPEAMCKDPFQAIRDDFSKERVVLIPVPKSDVKIDETHITSSWKVSFDETEHLLFACLDDLSPNIRTCFHLLKLFRCFLPMRMTLIEEHGSWTCHPVISSHVLYNTLLEVVIQHPSKADWEDKLLPGRMVNVLDALAKLTYKDFLSEKEEPSLQVSHLNNKHQESLKYVLRSDLKEIVNIIGQPREQRRGSKEKHTSKMRRASVYSKYDAICVLGLIAMGGVHYTVHSGWKGVYEYCHLKEKTCVGITDDFYCYRVPTPKVSCEKFHLYENMYEFILKKFETS